jgi:hypothetical protein
VGARLVPKTFIRRLQAIELSYRSFAYFSVISVLAVPIGDLGFAVTLPVVGLQIAVGVIATAIAGGAVFTGWAVIARARLTGVTKLLALVLLLVVAGALRGIAIFWLLLFFEVDSIRDLGSRIVASIVTTLVWLLMLALFDSVAAEFSRNYLDLVRKVLKHREAALGVSERAEVITRIQTKMDRIDVPPENNLIAQRQLSALAKQLRAELLAQVRTTGHELWAVKSVDYPRLKVLPVLKMAVSQLQYSYSFVATSWGILSFTYVANDLGVLQGLMQITASLLLFAVLHALYMRFMQSWATGRPWVNVAYLLLVGFLVGVPNGIFGYFQSWLGWGSLLFFLVVLATAAVPVIESALNISDQARHAFIADLVSLLPQTQGPGQGHTPGEDNAPTPASREQLASFLHNSLQAEIRGIIASLEAGAKHPQQVDAGRASLSRLRSLVSRSLDQDFTSFHQAPQDHLLRVVEGWRGILDLSVSWRVPQDALKDERLPVIVQIIEEVASNSVVHGAATVLHVDVGKDSEDFIISVTHDGTEPPEHEGGEGLNWLSQYYNEPFIDPQATREFRV